LKPAQANSLRSYLEKTHHTHKKVGGVDQDEGPEFKPQYRKKKCIYIFIYGICRGRDIA
jgi:hypothetical protein